MEQENSPLRHDCNRWWVQLKGRTSSCEEQQEVEVPVLKREGGSARSSDEGLVIGLEQRGRLVGCRPVINRDREESHGRHTFGR